MNHCFRGDFLITMVASFSGNKQGNKEDPIKHFSLFQRAFFRRPVFVFVCSQLTKFAVFNRQTTSANGNLLSFVFSH